MWPGRRPGLLLSCLAACCGAIPEIQWVDPGNGTSLATKPEEILVMFSEAVQPSAGAELEICSQADPYGGCTAGCHTKGTQTADGFKLRKSGQLASWSVQGMTFQTGCRYNLQLAPGTFSATQNPVQALAGTSWGFNVFLPSPRLQEGLFQHAATTSLRIVVTYDLDVLVTCRARPSPTGRTELPRETEPQSVARSTRATVELPGLIPGQSYVVECSAARADMHTSTSGWSSIGTFSTLEDTNANLAGLRVRTAHFCNDGRKLPFVDQLLMPVFTPSVLSYQVTVFHADWQRDCGGSTGDAKWLVAAQPTQESPYASVDTTWSGALQVGEAWQLSLPASEISSSISVDFEVSAHSALAPRRSYSVVVSANRSSAGAGALPMSPVTTTAPGSLPTTSTATLAGTTGLQADEGAPTTTTVSSGQPTGSCQNVAAQLGAAEFARTDCFASMLEAETCSLTCQQGKQTVGAYKCLDGLIVGAPSCTLPGTATEVVNKVAGILDLTMSSADDTNVDITPELRSAVQRSLSASLGVQLSDISKADLVKMPAAGGRLLQGAESGLRRRLSPQTLRLTYEVVVQSAVSLPRVTAGLAALSAPRATAERTAFARGLAQDGYMLSSAVEVHSPISFEDTVLAAAGPAPAPVPTPTPTPPPPSDSGGQQQGAGGPDDEPSGGLGLGAIIGIVAGSLGFLLCVGAALLYFFRFRPGFANL